jgi:glycosyltransferase involved in cell wall biosynthesis
LKLPGTIRSVSPDVIHSRSVPPVAVVTAHWARLLSRTPLVVDWYDPPTDGGRLHNYANRYAVRAHSRGVSPSEYVRTKVREWGADGADIDVVPTGIEMPKIRETDPDTTGGDIVFSRRLDDDCGLETLLLALAEFRDYDWQATIIGDGPARKRFERQVHDLRIDDCVTFVGEKSVTERIALFKNAHVYVQTAERASFAHDLARALACGCIGIVEYHVNSSAHELVEAETRGFLATSAQELTERLVEARALERRNVDESFARYDESEMVSQYVDIYRDLGAND